MKVVVAGAGMGGLVLAQALIAAGDEVVVLERDRGPEQTGGYRLHLNEAACVVIRDHVAPTVWQALLAASARAGSMPRLTLHDHRLRPLAVPRSDPGEERLLVDRRYLRRMLLHDIADHVVWSEPVSGFDHRPDEVVVTTASGEYKADLLVGADGARSAVTTQLLGRSPAGDLGMAAVAARVPMSSVGQLEPVVTEAGLLAIGPDGTGLFLSRSTRKEYAAVDAACSDFSSLDQEELIWSVIAPSDRISEELDDLNRLLAAWDPRLRRLPELSTPDSITRFPLLAADPARELMPWPAGRVTALGDAVHAMPPTGGQGAATAIRDAGVLAQALTEVRSGQVTLPVAVADYQRAISTYAPGAVAESLEPLRWMRLLSRPGGRLVAVAGLSTLATAAAAHRRFGRARTRGIS